jgi:hypothetical protein
MCLTSSKFELEYDSKIDDFVGYGYKVVSHRVYNKLARKRWVEAKAQAIGGSVNEIKTRRIATRRNKKVYYTPGFHIFIKRDDAHNYYYSFRDNILIKVAYRGVLAFGSNDTHDKFGNKRQGMCVITRYMKLAAKES